MKGNPNLVHSEIDALYEYDFNISGETIEKILSLPRPSLIKDLEEVLDEATRNFKDYDGFYDEEPEETLFLAPAHAIFLLGELEAIEALPTINQFLKKDEEFLDFWLGDLLTEEVWQAIYKLAASDIKALFPFIMEPVDYVFAKTGHTRAALTYMALNTKKRKILVADYKRLTQVLIEQASASSEFTDENDTLTSVVFDAIKYGLLELEEEIRIAIESDLIDDYGENDWEIVHDLLVKNEPDVSIMTIYEHYEAIQEWYNYEGEVKDVNFEVMNNIDKIPKTKNIDPRLAPKTIYNETIPFKKTTPDVGRNEPCPCGSGKKYKKCCLRK
ncbi:MAG: SEC-C metal-binding domain-containing protein [Saprospiraceae bacterium]